MADGHVEWRLRDSFGDVEIEVRPVSSDEETREASLRELRRLVGDFKARSPAARRVLLEVYAALQGLGPGSVRGHAFDFDSGSTRMAAIGDDLLWQARAGNLVVRRGVKKSVVVLLPDVPVEEPLGPAPESERLPDVYVLAAALKLIGDTPLVRHPVRVLDPDTGEVVVDGLTTDDHGIVRTETPANKVYRIEIVDRDPERSWLPTVATKQPVLRCLLVDPTGAPVPGLELTVKDIDGVATDYASDDDGSLEIPVLRLAPYEVVVGDDSSWVHSLLHVDGDAAYEVVVPNRLEDGGTGIDPDDRLTRSWSYVDDDHDDGDSA